MNLAPILRAHNTTARVFALEQAYGTWAEHYEKCTTCNRGDWFDPYVEDLCEYGQSLLTRWKQSAAVTVPIIEKAILV